MIFLRRSMVVSISFEIESFSPNEKIVCLEASCAGKLYYQGHAKDFSFNCEVEDGKKYILEVKATNITKEIKKNGEFGFKIKRFSINGVCLEWFDYMAKSENPGLDNPVWQDRNADYINMPDGKWTFEFETPLTHYFYDLHQKLMSKMLNNSLSKAKAN